MDSGLVGRYAVLGTRIVQNVGYDSVVDTS